MLLILFVTMPSQLLLLLLLLLLAIGCMVTDMLLLLLQLLLSSVINTVVVMVTSVAVHPGLPVSLLSAILVHGAVVLMTHRIVEVTCVVAVF